ncbi:hypothetical protein C922_04529, partial [Plasmodium inui San Antonio 1]
KPETTLGAGREDQHRNPRKGNRESRGRHRQRKPRSSRITGQEPKIKELAYLPSKQAATKRGNFKEGEDMCGPHKGQINKGDNSYEGNIQGIQADENSPQVEEDIQKNRSPSGRILTSRGAGNAQIKEMPNLKI